MPQISPPERGQPIDVDYLYEIVSAINTINNQIVSTSNAESRVSGANPISTDAVKTSSLKFYAAQVPIASGKFDADQTFTQKVVFPSNFLYPPVVTVTPLVQNFKEQSKNVIVAIENVTTGAVDVLLTFKKSGQTDVDVHLIAIGQS
jgi:hypothetical protein